MIFYEKSLFLAVNASLRWLNNVNGVYLVQVSLVLINQQGFFISSGIGPCFQLAGGLCKLYANTGGKLQIQVASQSTLSMHNYTPHVISGNDKNMQLTLLSQRKLALTEEI
jgi:hypothetical protein